MMWREVDEPGVGDGWVGEKNNLVHSIFECISLGS